MFYGVLMQHPPIDRAIAIAGSEAKLASITGWSQVGINKAKRRGRASAELAIAIHRATDGHVSAAELRPDLFPPGYSPPALAPQPEAAE